MMKPGKAQALVFAVVLMGASGFSLLSYGQEKTAAATETKPPPITEKVVPPPSEKKQGQPREMWFDFVINAMPATLLVGIGTGDFAASNAEGLRETASEVYLMPNLSAGLGMGLEDFYAEVTAGPGILVGQNFRSFFFQFLLAGSYMATDSFNIGPRVGLMYFFSPEWTGTADVSFDETWGYLLGLQISLGDRIRYIVAVDYVGMEFSALAGSRFKPSADKLDFDALAVQFGVRGEF